MAYQLVSLLEEADVVSLFHKIEDMCFKNRKTGSIVYSQRKEGSPEKYYMVSTNDYPSDPWRMVTLEIFVEYWGISIKQTTFIGEGHREVKYLDTSVHREVKYLDTSGLSEVLMRGEM